jgi:hypothetical protein
MPVEGQVWMHNELGVRFKILMLVQMADDAKDGVVLAAPGYSTWAMHVSYLHRTFKLEEG